MGFGIWGLRFELWLGGSKSLRVRRFDVGLIGFRDSYSMLFRIECS